MTDLTDSEPNEADEYTPAQLEEMAAMVAEVMPISGGGTLAAALRIYVRGLVRSALAARGATERGQLLLPETMTPAIDQALGEPNFRTGPIAHLFRDTGEDIPPKMEREQAFVLFWLLRLAIEHGENWRRVAGAEIDRRLDLREATGQAQDSQTS